MCVVTSILLKIFGTKMRLFWKFKKFLILRGYTRLFLRLKFHATSPFSASSESGFIYVCPRSFATTWLLGFDKSPCPPNVQLNCNRHLAPQLGDDIVGLEICLASGHGKLHPSRQVFIANRFFEIFQFCLILGFDPTSFVKIDRFPAAGGGIFV